MLIYANWLDTLSDKQEVSSSSLEVSTIFGSLAQLVERLLRTQGVKGSNPLCIHYADVINRGNDPD